MLVVVVDDILHVASSNTVITEFSSLMAKEYDFKNLGVPSLMIGVNISVSKDNIRLNQSHYIRCLAEKFGQLSAVNVSYPASVHGCLGSAQCSDSEPLDVSTCPYLSLVGGLLWVTITRPDVATVVSRACQHSKNPTRAHWKAAIRILRYLLTTADFALVYPRSVRPVTVTAYADAAFANEIKQRSRYGHAIYVSGCLVCWLTKATKSVCLSTAEAEFVAAAEAVKDILWLRNFLAELGFSQSAPSELYEDNQACVAMVNNHIVSGRNRHFCVKMAWLREQVTSGVVVFVFLSLAKITSQIFSPRFSLPMLISNSPSLSFVLWVYCRGGRDETYPQHTPIPITTMVYTMSSDILSPPTLKSALSIASSRLATIGLSVTHP